MEPKDTKILLVEDNPTIIDVYTTKFKQMGYNYKQVGDGEAGVQEAGEFMPHIILLDVILPKKDGFAVLKSIKSNEKTKNIPVIMFTSLGQEGDVKKALELGASSHMTKSDSTPAQVVEKIEEVLKLKKQ